MLTRVAEARGQAYGYTAAAERASQAWNASGMAADPLDREAGWRLRREIEEIKHGFYR